MKKRISVILCALVYGAAPAVGTAAERPRVAVTCNATAEPLTYLCDFTVTGRKSGMPIEGADFKVGADMPSMPLAHNVRPIRPAAGDTPGMYQGELHLEMQGEWALKIEFRKPVRDLIIVKQAFGN